MDIPRFPVWDGCLNVSSTTGLFVESLSAPLRDETKACSTQATCQCMLLPRVFWSLACMSTMPLVHSRPQEKVCDMQLAGRKRTAQEGTQSQSGDKQSTYGAYTKKREEEGRQGQCTGVLTCIGDDVTPGVIDVDHVHGEWPLAFRKKLP